VLTLPKVLLPALTSGTCMCSNWSVYTLRLPQLGTLVTSKSCGTGVYTFLPFTSGRFGTVATQSWVVRGIPPVSATVRHVTPTEDWAKLPESLAESEWELQARLPTKWRQRRQKCACTFPVPSLSLLWVFVEGKSCGIIKDVARPASCALPHLSHKSPRPPKQRDFP
jgi:hypothetical protein